MKPRLEPGLITRGTTTLNLNDLRDDCVYLFLDESTRKVSQGKKNQPVLENYDHRDDPNYYFGGILATKEQLLAIDKGFKEIIDEVKGVISGEGICNIELHANELLNIAWSKDGNRKNTVWQKLYDTKPENADPAKYNPVNYYLKAMEVIEESGAVCLVHGVHVRRFIEVYGEAYDPGAACLLLLLKEASRRQNRDTMPVPHSHDGKKLPVVVYVDRVSKSMIQNVDNIINKAIEVIRDPELEQKQWILREESLQHIQSVEQLESDESTAIQAADLVAYCLRGICDIMTMSNEVKASTFATLYAPIADRSWLYKWYPRPMHLDPTSDIVQEIVKDIMDNVVRKAVGETTAAEIDANLKTHLADRRKAYFGKLPKPSAKK